MKSKSAVLSTLGSAIAVFCLFSLFVPLAAAQAQVQGQWQTLSNTMPVNPIHVALLRTGKVLAIGGSENYAPNLAAGQFRAAIYDPATGNVTIQNIPWDMFCTGMSQLADGRVFIAGGNLQYDPFLGLPRTSIYDPLTSQYVDMPN